MSKYKTILNDFKAESYTITNKITRAYYNLSEKMANGNYPDALRKQYIKEEAEEMKAAICQLIDNLVNSFCN